MLAPMSRGAAGEPIRWRIHLPVPPEVVYRALDSDAGRASFWAESAVERGGAVEFVFADGTRHRARVLERDPPRRFALEYFGGRAELELAPDGAGGTDLTLVHAGVAAEEWVETHAGWLNVLLPLKAAVAFGVDLRNHDPARTWAQGYADQ